MDREETGFASTPPQGFLRRHRSVIITIGAIVVTIVLLVMFVQHKQQVQAQQAAERRGGGFRPHPGA